MYIKFKVTDGGRADGGHGLMGALNWAMTASAGDTATASDFTGSYENEITDFLVISNDEAGGWTNYETIFVSTSNHTWNGGWQADSPKEGRSFKKRFRVASQSTTTSHYGKWTPQGGFYDADTSSYILGMTSLAAYKSSTTSSRRNAFFANLSPSQLTWGWWNASVTSKYVYLWPDGNYNATTGCRYLAGQADLAGTPAFLLNAASDNFASVNFYTGSTDTGGELGNSTSTTYKFDYIDRYFANIDGGGPTSTDSGTSSRVSSGASRSISEGGVPWDLGPTHYYNVIGSYESALPVFDDYGSSTGGLSPIWVMSPFRGVPPQTIEGIYYYSPRTITNTTQALEWSQRVAPKYNGRLIYDDNGDKYVLYHSWGSMQIKAIRVM